MYYFAPSVSVWILVIISIDRLLSILRPTRFLFRKRTSYQYLACLLAILFSFLFYFPLFFTTIKDELNYNKTINIFHLINQCSNIENTMDVKFAVTSIASNFLFFLLNFPLVFYFIMQNFIQIDEHLDYLITVLVSILYYSFYGTMFYSNFFVNTLFKKELYAFLNETIDCLKSKLINFD